MPLKKYVLTGGTSVGKTTVIDLLAKLGHPTFPEFSRAIINRELKKENGILPWNNPALFQDMYAKEQVQEEKDIGKYVHLDVSAKLDPSGDVSVDTDTDMSTTEKDYIFMDRCIIDGIAFCQHAKVPIPPEISRYVQKLRDEGLDYDLIFILEPLDQYHFDEGRVLRPEESLSIQGLITNAYASYGYSLISVPFMSPEERVKFILDKVKKKTNPFR